MRVGAGVRVRGRGRTRVRVRIRVSALLKWAHHLRQPPRLGRERRDLARPLGGLDLGRAQLAG